MKTHMIRTDGIELATQAFGNSTHPPVLPIMGQMASMLWWPDGFCERLAARGFHVIRYDNRDTGLSTKYKPGEPSYTLDDMADDMVRVLDAYGLSSAHVVGMSLGGMIAQLAALKYPQRVRSLTAISTSPIGQDMSHLPGMTEAYAEHGASGADIDWTNREQAIDFVARDAKMIAGTAYPHDAAQARAFIERDYERSGGYLSATNHFILKGGDGWKGRLGEMKAPLLVVHGTADPLLPVEQGAALSQAVAGSKFVRLEGGGHELHPDHWDQIVDAVVEHARATDGASDAVDARANRHSGETS